jgi:hypothetical protein
MNKTLDQKLAALRADPHGCREFILADAKDADMGFGVGAPGRSPERYAVGAAGNGPRFKTLAEYRQQIREIVAQGVVDIMLMSASTNEILTIEERIFDDSPVTPAARANDTTDIFVVRGSRIPESPALPFRTASVDQIQCGRVDCPPEERVRGANLGLYSVTFNNDAALDRETLQRYKEFREEAERKGFRHFLEVFDPNVPGRVPPEKLGEFVNDMIVRSLAGVTSRGRPLFLKIVYHGPRALEELVRYDPQLIVGILGGSAGTTRDAFQLIHEAQKYGARVALFGRKINQAEHQLAFIRMLRHIVDGDLGPTEAVRAYHGVLQELGITPDRPLEKDLELQTNVMSYHGGGTTISLPGETPPSAPPAAATASAASADQPPDFRTISPAARLAYHRARLNRMFGESHQET